MPPMKIKNQRQLNEHLQLLEEKRDFYEKLVINDATEILKVIRDPVPLIKRTVKNLAGDPEFRSDLFQIGLNYIAGFLFKKFQAGDSKGWLASLIRKIREFAQAQNK